MKSIPKFLTVSLLTVSLLAGCGSAVDPNVTEDTEELNQEEMDPSVEESTDESGE